MTARKIRYLVTKRDGDQPPRFYWQPRAELRENGWQTERLPNDEGAAIARAEALNTELDYWYKGAGADRLGTVNAYSVNAIIAEYRASRHFETLKQSTKRGYEQHLRAIAKWAGEEAVTSITSNDVQEIYELMRARTPARANHMIRVLRLVLHYARRRNYIQINPAEKPALVSTPPRQQVWTDEALETFVATADKMGRPSIGTAAMLSAFLGQRQGDLLRLTWTSYQDGRVTLRQSKTGQLIEVPTVPELRARLEETKRTATTILVSENTGQPYKSFNFQHVFREVRTEAAKVCPELEDLWFMDLRRTAVVWLAEAGCTEAQIAAVTGHQIESTRRILETYLPRSSPMAAAAIENLASRRAARQAAES